MVTMIGHDNSASLDMPDSIFQFNIYDGGENVGNITQIPLSNVKTQFKTINGESVVGTGNIVIEGGADWNAQEGDAGYIENKPCYVNLDNGRRITLDNANITLSSDNNWYEKIIIPIGEYHQISLYFYDINGNLTHYVLTEGQSVFDSHFGCKFTAVLNESDSCDLLLTDFGDPKEYVDTIFVETKLVYEYNNVIVQKLDSVYLPDTIARKSDIPVPIIINYNTIKDAANSEVNTISEQTWLKYIANDTYKNYDWIIQRDGIKYNCTVIPDYDNEHIQILYFTRNEIEGTSGPLGNAIMKYSGLRIQLLPYTENTYLIYKISNGGSLETREFVFGENYNNNAYLIAAAQMSGIDTIDCKWVYTTKANETITVNGQYFHIENSITNVDAIFSVKDKSLTYVDGNGLINKVTFADNGSYDISKNNPDIPDTVIKTTPQTLSDTDKNQALANLGIDPVVWKYLCNPFIVKQGSKFPDELLAEGVELDSKYHIPAMYRIFIEDETKVNSNASKGSTITPAYVYYRTMEGPAYSSSGEFVEASWYIDGSIDIHYSV